MIAFQQPRPFTYARDGHYGTQNAYSSQKTSALIQPSGKVLHARQPFRAAWKRTKQGKTSMLPWDGQYNPYDVTRQPSFFSGCPSGDADGERFSACHRAMCSTGLKCSEELVPYSSTSDRRSVRKHPKTLARGVFFSSGIQILKQDV